MEPFYLFGQFILQLAIIHPNVQAQMDNDLEYAKSITQKIVDYIEDEKRLNESLVPGWSQIMSQCVTIDEKGDIGYCNASTRGSDAEIFHQYEETNDTEAETNHLIALAKKKNISPLISTSFTPQVQQNLLGSKANVYIGSIDLSTYSLWGFGLVDDKD